MLAPAAHDLTALLTKPRSSRATYHVGDLAYDSQDKGNPTRAEVKQTASIAYELYENGRITLVQRRLGHRLFEYMAVKL